MRDYKRYPRRDPIKDYFPLPNEIFSLGLCDGEIVVYAYLLRCENRVTHQCYPSYNTIGNAVGLSKKTVAKHVKSLEEKCFIRTEPTTVTTKNGELRNGSLCYTIRPIQEAINYYHNKVLYELNQLAEKRRAEKKLERYDKAHPRSAQEGGDGACV